MASVLKVGIIGASANRGWAKSSHVPAVQGLAGLELGAVASGSQAKADAAANAFGAARGYGDAHDLLRDPAIDIVSIAVKVPDHRELVLGALAAGKHVYCEWPLGRNLAETQELAAAARAAGTHAAIGLQARSNPAVERARRLLAANAIGRTLSARIVSNAGAFGPEVESALAFAEDPVNGVTLVTIQGAHTLDLAIALLDGFADLSALATIQYPNVEVGDDRKPQVRTAPDHLLVQARVAGGSALSVEVAGGRPPAEATFHLEITGEEGSLRLDGGAVPGFQAGRLRLLLRGKPEAVDEGELASMPDPAVNVAGVYAALRDNIVHNTRTVPDFEHAVRLHRLIDDVLSSAESGSRKFALDRWPLPQ